MPSNNPSVGETWETTDPLTNQATQAVVVFTSPEIIDLVSRQGHSIQVPVRSFALVWRLVQVTPGHKCREASCNEDAVFRIDDLGTWVWVCPAHRPEWMVSSLSADGRDTHVEHRVDLRHSGDQPNRPDAGHAAPVDDVLPVRGSVWTNGTSFLRVVDTELLRGSLGRRLSVYGDVLYSLDENMKLGSEVVVWVVHFFDQYKLADMSWQEEPENPSSGSRPHPGEIWWSKDTYNTYEVLVSPDEHFVRLARDEGSGGVPLVEFQKWFSRTAPEPPCPVEKFVRKPAMARLLDEDVFDDTPDPV